MLLSLPEDIHYIILASWATPLVVVMGGTNRHFRSLYRSILRSRFRATFRESIQSGNAQGIPRDDYDQVMPRFLDYMRATGAMIAGYTALSVMDPNAVYRVPQITIIYVEEGRHSEWREWISTHLNFHVLQRKPGEDKHRPAEEIVTKFTANHNRKLHIVLQSHPIHSPLCNILLAVGTHLMNIITGDAILTAYPKLAIQHKAIIRRKHKRPICRAAVEAKEELFSKTAYEVIDVVLDSPGNTDSNPRKCHLYCVNRLRTTADKLNMEVAHCINDARERIIRDPWGRWADWRLGGIGCALCKQFSYPETSVEGEQRIRFY